MGSTIKTLTITSLALLSGLLLGYLLFGSKHQHDAGHAAPNASAASSEEVTWTCSMHPQIRQNEAGDCAICGMALIPLDGTPSDDPLVLKMTEEAVKLSSIQTSIVGATATGSDALQALRLSGKVKADERLASSQVTHVAGRIEKLYASFTGEPIHKGQKLADIYSPELIVAQRELIEALKLQEVNPALLEAARNKLRYWKISPELIANIETAGEIQETFPVYAQASGVVTQRRVAVGDHLREGEPLFDVINLNRVWVLFDAYESDLSSIAIGSTINFNTPAIPNQNFQARVTFIDPVIHPQSRVASVRVEVANSRGLLKPEMLVYGTLESKKTATLELIIPKSAVMWTGTQSVVYVKVPDEDIPSFQFREVSLGQAIGDNYQITAGLAAGEEVVTHGSFVIDAAAQLNNQTSMMNRQVDIKKEAKVMALPDYSGDTPLAFQEQLVLLANSYLLIKDALVATDPTEASTQAATFIAQLEATDHSPLKGEALNYWLEQQNALKTHTQSLQSLVDVEEQRHEFDFISELIIASLKVFGSSEDVFYVQYCPMAFDDTGANWLSAEDKVLNPYFGDKMLRCGIIKETIAGD